MKNLKQLLKKKEKYKYYQENVKMIKSSDKLGENNKSIKENRQNAQNKIK